MTLISIFSFFGVIAFIFFIVVLVYILNKILLLNRQITKVTGLISQFKESSKKTAFHEKQSQI